MQVQIEDLMQATPIKVSMSYAEAVTLVQVIDNNVNMNNHYPITKELYEQLKRIVDDPYFD